LIKKGKYLQWIFPAACVVLFVTIACPFLNAEYIGVMAHRSVVEDALDKGLENLTAEEENKLEDSYFIILRECGAEGEKYLQTELGEDAETLYDWYYSYDSVTEAESLHGELLYFNGSQSMYELDVREYSRIIRVSCEEIYMEDGAEYNGVLSFTSWEEDEHSWNLDLETWLDNGIDYFVNSTPHDFDDYLGENSIVEVNEQYDLWVSNIYMRCYADGYIEYIDIDGYLLEKE